MRRLTGMAAAIAVGALAVTACSSGSASSTSSGSPASGASTASGSSAKGAFNRSLFALLPKQIQQSKTIVVSNPLSNPPAAFLGTDGTTLYGIAPQLADALEPILGVTFKWVNTPFAGLIPGLQAGKFDIIWGSVTDTKAREKVIDFVDYSKEGARLMVAKGNPKNITGVGSLCGLTAGGLSGSVQLSLLSAQSQQCTTAGKGAITQVVYTELPTALLALRSGKIDAFFAGLGSADYQARAEGNGQLYQAAGPAYSPQRVGIGMMKDQGTLDKALQGGIQELIENGTYAKIFAQYFYQSLELTPDQVTINGGLT